MLANTRETYGLIAQSLHWITAALILALIPLGVFMHELPVSSAEEAAYKSWYYSLHKTLGVTLFLIAVVRVIWAVVQLHPKLLNGDKKLESLAAQTVHWMLYGAIIVMPLTGWLHHSAAEGFAPIWWPISQDLPFVPKSPQLAQFFGSAHFFTGVLLGLSIALHVGGALKHAVIDRDSTLTRMIPGRAPDIPANLPDPHFRHLPTVLAALSFLLIAGASTVTHLVGQPNSESGQTGIDQATIEEARWLIDPKKSRLEIEIVQSGTPVSGHFGTWNAAIIFDPDKLEASKVEVEIDIASLALGSVSPQAISPDFLNAALHPVAVFVSEDFADKGNGTFEAHGQLTLAGLTKPISLPFALKIADGRAFVEAEVPLDRLEFDIGKKGFPKDDLVGFQVVVRIVLEAQKAPSS